MTTLTLRMPDDVGEALREVAAREGRSMNEIAVKAIAQYASGRTRRRADALAKIVAEDQGLLARLAQ